MNAGKFISPEKHKSTREKFLRPQQRFLLFRIPRCPLFCETNSTSGKIRQMHHIAIQCRKSKSHATWLRIKHAPLARWAINPYHNFPTTQNVQTSLVKTELVYYHRKNRFQAYSYAAYAAVNMYPVHLKSLRLVYKNCNNNNKHV